MTLKKWCVIAIFSSLLVQCRMTGSKVQELEITNPDGSIEASAIPDHKRIQIYAGMKANVEIFLVASKGDLYSRFVWVKDGVERELIPEILYKGKRLDIDQKYYVRKRLFQRQVVPNEVEIMSYTPIGYEDGVLNSVRAIQTLAVGPATSSLKLCMGNPACNVKLNLQGEPRLVFDFDRPNLEGAEFDGVKVYLSTGIFVQLPGTSAWDDLDGDKRAIGPSSFTIAAVIPDTQAETLGYKMGYWIHRIDDLQTFEQKFKSQKEALKFLDRVATAKEIELKTFTGAGEERDPNHIDGIFIRPNEDANQNGQPSP